MRFSGSVPWAAAGEASWELDASLELGVAEAEPNLSRDLGPDVHPNQASQ